ncbi:glycoside hydrolase family 5 protein [Spirosoma sp. KUDC1026]|uniref:glycoside hydrolase family 5 protein n=1 Tax=Spirosoma sp. KUDC1026 TaxID=2745947 RepID=UPI00159BC9FC|nr:cellulase family glycosylhydrolase [Spirosoma sp. KUDC1026]QKZ14620.1 cellulase family glycosylhydrolase [Spirosoma sp. KUDC1026]
MHRRLFLQASLTAAAGLSQLPQQTLAYAASLPDPKPGNLPRWRGFNLLEKFVAGSTGPEPEGPYQERDFEWIANWDFNFVRLPMSYQCWATPDPKHWTKINERVLREVDQAVDYGKQYKLHVNLNLHRIPGYCVNPPAEPLNLWTDEQALEAAVFHWKHLAERYKGRPNREVSFDLINEPNTNEASYVRVVTALVEGIRSVDPERLIIVDGLQYGNQPVPQLAKLKLAQSTRGYLPMNVSHYGASWVPTLSDAPPPTWPANWMNVTWNAETLRKVAISPWQKLEKEGVGVHVGEWGCFNKTPHDVALRWMEDQLRLWKKAGWGWALWNFRGAFGILNSDRADVTYKNYQGEQLDEKMLKLLQNY